nr:piggyBac transposable element-derived protein 3-like [Labrus bergylta]
MPCPSIILAYNQAMEGIDLSDMLVHLYKTPMKSMRWYIPLFGYIIDVSIANAWLIYKRDCNLLKEKPMPLKKFSLSVAAALKKANKLPARAGQSVTLSPEFSSPPSRSAMTASDTGQHLAVREGGATSAKVECRDGGVPGVEMASCSFV